MLNLLIELLVFWLILMVVVGVFDTVLRPLLGNMHMSSRIVDIASLALLIVLIVYAANHIGYFGYFSR